MAYYPVHQTAMPGEDLGTGMQPCATRARYPVDRSRKIGGEGSGTAQADAIHGPRRGSDYRPDRDNPRRTPALRRSNISPQEAGHMVTIAGSSGRWNPRVDAPRHEQILGRETVDSASGTASPVLAGYGRSVGSLGPGLTSDSANAVRAVLRDDLSAGPQVYGTHRRCRSDLPVLCKRPGFTGPTASGCVPPLQPEKKGWH